MTVSMIRPLAGKSVIAKLRGERAIGSKKSNNSQ
jgi:hypothetical protein